MKKFFERGKMIACVIMARHAWLFTSGKAMDDITVLTKMAERAAKATGKYIHLEVAEADGTEIANHEFNK